VVLVFLVRAARLRKPFMIIFPVSVDIEWSARWNCCGGFPVRIDFFYFFFFRVCWFSIAGNYIMIFDNYTG
jgi:hypothetical protein